MKIQILSVETTTKVSKAGKNYQNAEVAYKNFDSGKVESKNINQYNKTFKHVAEALPGQTAEVGVMKNDAGYWEWDTFKRVQMTEQEKAAVPEGTTAGVKAAAVSAAKSTYETPEERARKQCYIVKQSSLSVASNLLSVGAKAPPKKEDVVDLAQYFVDYVFGEKKEDLFDLPNDLEVE